MSPAASTPMRGASSFAMTSAGMPMSATTT